MKKKFVIVLSLMALVIGYSCQEEFGLSGTLPDKESKVIVDKLNIEFAKAFCDGMLTEILLPSWAQEDDCDDPDCKQHEHAVDNKYSTLHEEHTCTHKQQGYMYNYPQVDNKGEQHQTHSDLPELKKSNIRLEWDRVRQWSDKKAVYVEVPMNLGDKLYALKKWYKKGEEMQNERSKVECMLVFEQKHEANAATECHIVTLIGTKEYLKGNKNRVKELYHKPNDGKFTGLVYKSTLNGHIRQGYYYTSGKITHKIFNKCVFKDRVVPENVTYYQMGMIDMAVNASSYFPGWEYYCPVCGNYHESEDDGQCDYVIEYCSGCHRPIDECECCYICGHDPCRCCYVCWDYPCRCCKICGDYPCQCCRTCNRYPCVCNDNKECPNCGYDPCVCCGVCHNYPCSCEPVAPPQGDCVGAKCSACGGIISITRSAYCPPCICQHLALPKELMDKTNFVPWYNGANCLTLAENILRNYGQTNVGSRVHAFRLTYEDNGVLKNWGNNPGVNYANAIRCIDRHIDADLVIIVGVNYDEKLGLNDGATDHFIVITGRGYDSDYGQYYYTYMDSATSNANDGCSVQNNRLYYDNNDYSFSGLSAIMGKIYSVVQVRPNDGNTENTEYIPNIN